jgi:hypothetical protein
MTRGMAMEDTTEPVHAVGDIFDAGPIEHIAKVVDSDGVLDFRFYEEHGFVVILDFPPSNATFIPELDRLLTEAVTAWLKVEITAVLYAGAVFRGTLLRLELSG